MSLGGYLIPRCQVPLECGLDSQAVGRSSKLGRGRGDPSPAFREFAAWAQDGKSIVDSVEGAGPGVGGGLRFSGCWAQGEVGGWKHSK